MAMLEDLKCFDDLVLYICSPRAASGAYAFPAGKIREAFQAEFGAPFEKVAADPGKKEALIRWAIEMRTGGRFRARE